MFKYKMEKINGLDYDFTSNENKSKWKGVLTSALKKVLEQVHPSLGARDEALEYVECLCLRLLGMLCAKPSPHTVQDVESRVQNTFPTPIDKWALKEAQEALDRGKKKSVLLLPVDKIHNLMQKELLLYKVDSTVSLFLVAVLEYISADILKLVGNYAKNIKHYEITCQDVQISMKVDKALTDMFYQDEGSNNVSERMNEMLVSAAPRTSSTYEEAVRELIASEKAYLKDIHMIIKVFKEEIKKLTTDSKDIELIFSNISDIYEVTYTLTGSLEDVMEMAPEYKAPYIGSCFEELAEAKEFDVYCKYGRDVTSPICRQTLLELLSRQEATLHTAGHGMHLALKYYLPALLTYPIWHFFSYMDFIRLLIGLSPAPEDKEMLTEVEGMLKPLRDELTHCVPSQMVPRSCGTLNQIKMRRSAAIQKIRELEKVVENWDSKDLGQCCNEFIREDTLIKINQKRLTERRVFLFDGLMVLCKSSSSSRRQSSIHHTSHPEFRLKERFFMRKVEIKDHEDTEEVKFAFEIVPRQMPSVVLCAKSLDEKNSWMADLVMLNNRSMLERVLDSILSRIEQQHPLKLPPPELYKFAEPDSSENIILEQRENGGGVPLIKGATLYKLVERLTYHIYADPKFIKTFLTTFRSFCSPNSLLDLLIERFHIPDPSKVYEQDLNDSDKLQKSNQREDWKKYKKEYCQPIQFRVLNVLRHWVDQHFYDFERDPELLAKLEDFLDSVATQNMKKWVESAKKTIKRKKENDSQRHNVAFVEIPPQIEWHISNCREDEFSILTLHPLEIARQLTIIEFDLYKLIKPSELVGTVWTKKDKDITSPNLLKMIKHTTNFTRWLEKNIVDTENLEERVAIVNRICEIMIALNEMNNFNGVLAISSAMQSAAVHRLKFTFQSISQQYRKVLDECKVDDHFKKYHEKLRSINPPCVPFLGMYLSNILHIEEGNSDFLPGTELINFFKRRKVADITSEIQQYQNQPYCFRIEFLIRNFLENLNPFDDMTDTEIQNYLYEKSMEIEPRGCKQLPKFPRKWPNLNLKSPGIKPKRSTGSVITSTMSTMSSTMTVNEDSLKSNSDSDSAVFAQVQIGTGQNSPTLSPSSPASQSLITWFTHNRSSSVSSVASTTSYRHPRSSESGISIQSHLPYRHTMHSTSSSGAPNSPGAPPRTPTSPLPYLPSVATSLTSVATAAASSSSAEATSPRLTITPPPPAPPPLPPRKRKDSSEVSSPMQVKQSAAAPPLPPKDPSPPPLPPRREPGSSPNTSFIGAAFHTLPNHPSLLYLAGTSGIGIGGGGCTLPLRPTNASQLHMRRHAHINPRTPREPIISSTNGGINIPPATPAKPPTISPRYGSSSESSSGQITPQLPPRPAVRSAGYTHGTMFQYPNTTTN